MRHERELIAETRAGQTRLLSPGVGFFSESVAPGQVLVPGSCGGTLTTLDLPVFLIVPAGVAGRIVSERPERVSKPVAYRDVLYQLAALDGTLEATDAESNAAGASGPVIKAPYAGRFWQRPSPDDPAFIEVGSKLEPGTAIGLIEVMKTFSHVTYAATAGLPERARVVRILVADGAEIGNGEALIEVEPA